MEMGSQAQVRDGKVERVRECGQGTNTLLLPSAPVSKTFLQFSGLDQHTGLGDASLASPPESCPGLINSHHLRGSDLAVPGGVTFQWS
jgi:hypothetical protein